MLINPTRLASLMALPVALMMASCSSDDKDLPGQGDPVKAPVKLRAIEAVYLPAPGQFVNVLPLYVTGDTPESMNTKALNAINDGSLVSLGAFGGSITLRMESPILNRDGKTDFKVSGNAFSGSAEPGIVSVSPDGITWYDLRGEDWDKTVPSLTVTYYPPTAEATEAKYILWTTDKGGTGWLTRNIAYHTQPYFPCWLDADATTMSFTARYLPDPMVLTESGLYVAASLAGYADSYPNDVSEAWLDLDNAVDADGNAVALSQVSYVRITTAVLAAHEALGETSTEVSSIYVPAE